MPRVITNDVITLGHAYSCLHCQDQHWNMGFHDKATKLKIDLLWIVNIRAARRDLIGKYFNVDTQRILLI